MTKHLQSLFEPVVIYSLVYIIFGLYKAIIALLCLWGLFQATIITSCVKPWRGCDATVTLGEGLAGLGCYGDSR